MDSAVLSDPAEAARAPDFLSRNGFRRATVPLLTSGATSDGESRSRTRLAQSRPAASCRWMRSSSTITPAPLRFRRRPCRARALAPHRSRSLDPPPAPRAQGPGLAGLTGEHHRAAGGDPLGHGQGMTGGEALGGAQPPGLLLPERPGRLVGLDAAGLRGRPKDVALLSRERDLVRAEDTGPGGTLNAQDQRPARVHAMK